MTSPDKSDALIPGWSGKREFISEGYWLMLKPLPKGKHTLHVKATIDAKDPKNKFELDVDYRITVTGK